MQEFEVSHVVRLYLRDSERKQLAKQKKKFKKRK